jgi:glycosyltransferase involved in cell wall biosynthesis
MDKPLVSVIIPTYNRDTYLREAIASVVKQSYAEIEILVIDDGSKQNYAEAICADYLNCNYHFKENGGLSSARNFGLSKAKGSFIAFLDDDDFWREDKIEKQVSVLQEKEEVDLIHSGAAVVDKDSKPTGDFIGASKTKEHFRSGNVFWNALGVWVAKSPTPLIRKEVFSSSFLFDEDIKVGEDVDFYQRLFYKHKVHYIGEPLAFYRVYDDENRLSTQRQRYVGLEQKMFNNFKKMGVTNPWVLHKIAQRILKMAIDNWKTAYPEKSLKISKFNKIFRPQYCLENCFKY